MNKDRMVLVVDDDRSVREALVNLLTSVGVQVRAFATAREFMQCKRPSVPACLVLDVRLPGESGLDLQREVARSGDHHLCRAATPHTR